MSPPLARSRAGTRAKVDAYWAANPSLVAKTYNATVGPHAAAERWTYTVPTKKLAQLLSVFAAIKRTTAATAAGEAKTMIEHDDETDQFQLGYAFLGADTNTVGDFDRDHVGEAGVYPSGTKFQARTSDGGTTGELEYIATALFLEFDV